MKYSFKQRLLLSFGIIIAAVAAGSGALYYFSNDLSAQAQKIITDKNLIAQQTAVVSVLASLKSDAPQAAVYQAAMEGALPGHNDLIGFPGWLNTIGTNHNVSVSFSFSGNNVPATAATPGSDGFSMSATGALEDLGAFLKDIETQASGFLLNINSFNLTGAGTSYTLQAQGVLFSR